MAWVGLGNAYTDCLGACVEQSIGSDPELMAQCVATCKANFPIESAAETGVRPKEAGVLISGIPNQYLILGAVGLVVALLLMRR